MLLKAAEAIYNKAVPEPERLWERAGAEGKLYLPGRYTGETEMDDGQLIRQTGETWLPDFNLSVDRCEDTNYREVCDDNGNIASKVYDFVFTLSDRVDRRARLVLPCMGAEDLESTPVGTCGTAFTTTIDGYAGMRSLSLSQTANIPVIQVGCEYSGPGSDVMDILSVAKKSPQIAMTKSVQAELVIINNIIERFGLSRQIVPHGDSRGGISAVGQAALADAKDFVDLTVPYMDPKAVVIHDRVTFDQVPKALEWLVREITLGSVVLSKVLAEGDCKGIASTLSTNPRCLTGTMAGILPALLSGEAGRFTDALHPEQYGCVVAYGEDRLYDSGNWEAGLSRHPNVVIKEVKKGLHMHLMAKESTSQQVNRISEVVPHIINDSLGKTALCRAVHCSEAELERQYAAAA
jgi:hypothetical protein